MKKIIIAILSALIAFGAISTNPVPVGAATKPVVYLTFDGGPTVESAQGYFDVLEAYGAKGTFFVRGDAVETNKETLLEMRNSGHAIANGGLDGVTLTSSNAQHSLSTTNAILAESLNVGATCYRPVNGVTSKEVYETARSLGLTNQKWTASSTSDPHGGGWDVEIPAEGNYYTTLEKLDTIKDGDVVRISDAHYNTKFPLDGWLAENSSKFDFLPLEGCGALATETPIDPNNPQVWHRYKTGRLYTAYFGRYPDHGGWGYWNHVNINGYGLDKISNQFANSKEFKNTYGDTTDEEFIELVYNNVMGRGSDEAGKSYWLGHMKNGLTRGEVMLYFSESEEYAYVAGPILTGEHWDGNLRTSYLNAADTTAEPVVPKK